MKHIGKLEDRRLAALPPDAVPVCGAELKAEDSCVLAAMESDCDACRSKFMISSTSEKGCAPREAPKWEQQASLAVKKRSF